MENLLFTMRQLGSHIFKTPEFWDIGHGPGAQGVAPSCWDAVLEGVKSFL